MATVLGIASDGRGFTIDGEPMFLLGASYFAGLGACEEFLADDLADLKRRRFNWLRVWATWAAFGNDVSAVDAAGEEREPYLDRLVALCRRADEMGLVVDVTLSRGEAVMGPVAPGDDEAHVAAAALLAEALAGLRNVYFDLANERNVGDARGVPIATVRRLRDRLKAVDPSRLVTASHAGDVEGDVLYDYLAAAKVDFLAVHRPREAGSPAATEVKTRNLLRRVERLGRKVPVHYQEPFRRGWGDWQPQPADYLADLAAALAGGAAGWCLHNGHTAGAADGRPRRCFDMRPSEGRLVDQLDDGERTVLRQAGKTIWGD